MPSMISLGLLSLASLAAAGPYPAREWAKPDCSLPAPTGRGARWYARVCGTTTDAVALSVATGSAEINEAPADMTVTTFQTLIVSASALSDINSIAAVNAAPVASTVTPEAAPAVTSTLVTVAQNFRKTSSTPVAVAAATPAAASPAAASPVAASPVAVAASAASPASVAASSGGKRGVAYNDAKYVAPFSSGKKVSWAYNWGSAGSGLPSGFEFVPMLWGNGAGPTKNWVSDATKAIASGSTALLGFNEPDHPQQANLPYDVAATAYKTLVTPFAGKARLGSVAVTNGGGAMGLTYLTNFMNACTDCKIDFVVIHWYDAATNVQYFKDHVTQAHTLTGKPVWITEFGTTSGTADQINTFVQTVLPWLESQSFVERYSYFMASDGLLNTGTALSNYGQTYATI